MWIFIYLSNNKVEWQIQSFQSRNEQKLYFETLISVIARHRNMLSDMKTEQSAKSSQGETVRLIQFLQ